MNKSVGGDVPRPRDDSRACLGRLRGGQFHALVDLAEALEREGDPRSPVVDRLLAGAMARLECYRGRASFGPAAAAEWQRLTAAVLCVMGLPRFETIAVAAERLLARQEVR